ncbi:hemK methyltransferase family member 1-like [Dorcoceras hygrometricum]|uniref:HemK methyltransferase family member 1-like n=1 Tax=Dorcoceras hygrometricum TaxID=472368 RepID=A0A2Z7B8D3_9LAMI|nr:hemK methyltransferase family member 1-like [Dorcoceras hygrometricum]
MKLCTLTRTISSIIQPALSFRPNPGRPISFAAVSPTPQTPLYLRPAVFHDSLTELKKWHKWAKGLASSVGSAFLELDNGPDSTLLHRELDWLIQDAFQHRSDLNPDESLDDAGVVSLRVSLDDLYELWKQRIEGRRPFQYVVGCEHWRDLILSVEEGVLIPRPETEIIVDLVEEAVKESRELGSGLWADLGTGSGALAIGIVRLLEDSGRVVATDLSDIAVAVASYNVQRYGLQDRVAVRRGSWYESLQGDEGKLAGLVSNPPYIPSADIDGLQAEVCNHEPRLALDGGGDGMSDLLHLSSGAAMMLKPGGFFAFETNGDTQSEFLQDYMDTEMKGSFCRLKIVSDFTGIKRFLTGYRAR